MKIKELENQIIEARKYYYNTSTPLMSDEDYDLLEEALRKQDPNNPILIKVGVTPDNKSLLPFRMPSIDKLIDIDKFKGDEFIVMDKHDGISVGMVGYNHQWKLYTRGDDTFGADISHVAKYIKLPKPPKNKVLVRGEIQIKEKTFQKYFNKGSSRSTCSGLLNRKEDFDDLKFLDIIAYQLVADLTPEQQLEKLTKVGFRVPKFIKVKKLSKDKLEKYLRLRKEKSEYILDGLVISKNVILPIPKEGNPKHTKKFKLNVDFQLTEVEKVVWQPSRYMKLSPVIVIKPVEIKGVKISRLTGFNYKFIKENNLGKGSLIKVCRSGDVIPDLRKEDIIKSTKADLPKCKYEVKGVHAYLTEVTDEVRIKEITSFFKIVGVKYLSIGIVRNLFNNGYDSIIKILEAKVNDLEKLEGFKKTLATKIVSNIKKCMSCIELPLLMHASNKFSSELGYKRLKLITDNLDFKNGTGNYNDLMKLKGLDDKLVNAYINGRNAFYIFYADAFDYFTLKTRQDRLSNELEGNTYCFTGFRDKNLEQDIFNRGGKITSGMSKKVTHLIVKDKKLVNSKTKFAKENNIRIYTKNEL